MTRISLWLSGLGLAALSMGTLIYVFLRPEGSSYLNQYYSLYQPLPYIPFMNNLPSFFHIFAFSLFSISVLGRKYAFHICLFWFVLNVAFELIQHPNLSQNIDFLGILRAYAGGTFDYLDILASIMGACLPFGFVRLLERSHHAEI